MIAKIDDAFKLNSLCPTVLRSRCQAMRLLSGLNEEASLGDSQGVTAVEKALCTAAVILSDIR